MPEKKNIEKQHSVFAQWKSQ